MSVATARAAAAGPATVVEGLPDSRWDEYVRRHPDASVYHVARWPRLIARAFHHDVRLLAATRSGAVTGVLPIVCSRTRLFGRFAVSLPFVNYGGVLADDEVSARALLDAGVALARETGASHLELRHQRAHFSELSSRRHKVGMTMSLAATADLQWQALDRKIRNQVRKAEKSGFEVRQGGVERLDDFCGVFSRNMRDLGTPVYPRGFFEEMLRAFPDSSRVFVVALRGRPVAAAVAQWFRDRFEVPSAGSLKELRALCPNVLLYWEMVRFAAASGFRTFDFGRSTPNDGTFLFKQQWGATPHPLVWEYWTPGAPLPDRTRDNPKFAAAIAAWQRLPVPIATALGPVIARHLP